MANRRYPEVTTPAGRFSYPYIAKPDYGNETFPKPEGEIGTDILLDKDAPATKAFLAELEPYLEEAKAIAEERKKAGKKISANPLYTEVYNEDEELTGEIKIKIKSRFKGTSKRTGEKYEKKVIVYDAKLNRLDPIPNIYGGTIGKVRAQISPYYIPGTGMYGVKLYFQAAQILELVEGSDQHNSGFMPEEGYEKEEEPAFENMNEGNF